MSRYLCGRCGAAVLDGRTLVEVRRPIGGVKTGHITLCPDCSELFTSWMETPRAAAHAVLTTPAILPGIHTVTR